VRLVGEEDSDRVLLVAAGGLFLELLAREQSSAQSLSDRHRELLGLEAVRDIDQRSCRGREGQAVAPDGRHLFTVRAGMEGDARRPAQPAVPASEGAASAGTGYSTRFVGTTTNSVIERTVDEAGRLSAVPWHDNLTVKAICESIYARATP
jgi:hypothetical protein